MVTGKDSLIAQKFLGQHWLKDQQILNQIVDLADPDCSSVVEIGPGLGDLTAILLNRQFRVLAVEIDQKLISLLQKKFQSEVENHSLTLINRDIRQFDFNQINDDYQIVANIPYYLTSYLLQILTKLNRQPVRITLLVQEEVAKRLVATAGQLSLLTISVLLDYEIEYGFKVDKLFFDPSPKVNSAVIVLKPRLKTYFPDIDKEKFLKFVSLGFRQKRKKIINSLSLYRGQKKLKLILEEINLSGDLRAQNLSLDDWYQLYVNL